MMEGWVFFTLAAGLFWVIAGKYTIKSVVWFPTKSMLRPKVFQEMTANVGVKKYFLRDILS